MATQCSLLSLFLAASLIALASCAAIRPVTSQEKDEAESKEMNLVQPRLESRIFKIVDELPDDADRAPLADDKDDDGAVAMTYVDASVFRKGAAVTLPGVMKGKGAFSTKKPVSNVNKHVKEEMEMKKERVVAPSDKLEPPAEDGQLVDILSAIRDIIDSEGKNDGDEETAAVVAPGDAPATTTTHEVYELPRLSPPIWSHSSRAEALSDPLRLPMIEPYDREDRYSHSIAQGAFW